MDFIVGVHHVNSEGPSTEPYRQDSDYLDKTPYNVALNNFATNRKEMATNQKLHLNNYVQEATEQNSCLRGRSETSLVMHELWKN